MSHHPAPPHRAPPRPSPLVILLDIDGTLIGDITPQVALFDIVNRLKGSARIPYLGKDVQSRLKGGVVRPFVQEFVKDLQEYGVEFFVYTAAEKKWAEYIIKQLEAAYGIKFNRPIFTRNNCHMVNGDYRKSFREVRPAILRCLRKKHPHITADSLQNMMIAIDNNTVYGGPDSRSLILCNTYNYSLPENIPAYISKEVFERHYEDICATLANYHRYFRSMKVTPNYMRFERQFYFRYIDDLTLSIKNRREASMDPLFKIIRNFIIGKNIKSFNDNVVQYLNTKVRSHGVHHTTTPRTAPAQPASPTPHPTPNHPKKRTFF